MRVDDISRARAPENPLNQDSDLADAFEKAVALGTREP